MRKRWIISILIAAGILLFVASFPGLFSLPLLKQIVVRKVERKVGQKVTIDKVQFSWTGPQRIQGVHITAPEISGVIQEISSNVPFWSIRSFEAGIENIRGSGTTNSGGKRGNFSIQGTRVAGEITLNFSAEQMPTSVTLKLLKANPSFASLIGPFFNAKGLAAMKDCAGRVDLDFTSPQTQGNLHASFTPRGFTLRAPFTLSLYLTPELTQSLTNGALSIQSQTPAYVEIQPKDFFLPRPFSLAKLQIGKGSLDVSKVLLQHVNLAPLASLLKADRLTASQIDMWCTRVDFSLKQGNFSMGRLDTLLQNSVHLCAWGDANLLKSQLAMIFGIPADTLAKSLRIPNLPSSYVLQIPVTGSFQHPDIDTGGATAKIAMLIAGKQAQKQGGILGGAAAILGKLAEEKAPSPKRPFPWEK